MAEIKYFNSEKTYREHPGLKEAEEFADYMRQLSETAEDENADDITRYKAEKEWEANEEELFRCLLLISEAYPRKRTGRLF